MPPSLQTQVMLPSLESKICTHSLAAILQTISYALHAYDTDIFVANAEGLLLLREAMRQDAHACKVPVRTSILRHLITLLEDGNDCSATWSRAAQAQDVTLVLIRSLQKAHLLQGQLCAQVIYRYREETFRFRMNKYSRSPGVQVFAVCIKSTCGLRTLCCPRMLAVVLVHSALHQNIKPLLTWCVT